MSKSAAIIGITGQDGSYLAKLLLDKGYTVSGITRDLLEYNNSNLEFLGIKNAINLVEISSMDKERVVKFLQKVTPDEVYNLSSQSSVGYSFKDPFSTLQYNILSVLNWLEAIKTVNKNIKFYQASSSEMFGNVSRKDLPLTETQIFHPASPYGISKAAAHWVSVNYREAYDLFACCGILFNHESCLRGQDYVVKKIVNGALKIKLGIRTEPISVGNTTIKRDWGYAPKYVEAMWKIVQHDKPEDFLICSGNIMSLDQLIDLVFDKVGLDRATHLIIDPSLFRPVDLEEIYGDNTKAKNMLNWDYQISNADLVDLLIRDEMEYIEWKK